MLPSVCFTPRRSFRRLHCNRMSGCDEAKFTNTRRWAAGRRCQSMIHGSLQVAMPLWDNCVLHIVLIGAGMVTDFAWRGCYAVTYYWCVIIENHVEVNWLRRRWSLDGDTVPRPWSKSHNGEDALFERRWVIVNRYAYKFNGVLPGEPQPCLYNPGDKLLRDRLFSSNIQLLSTAKRLSSPDWSVMMNGTKPGEMIPFWWFVQPVADFMVYLYSIRLDEITISSLLYREYFGYTMLITLHCLQCFFVSSLNNRPV